MFSFDMPFQPIVPCPFGIRVNDVLQKHVKIMGHLIINAGLTPWQGMILSKSHWATATASSFMASWPSFFTAFHTYFLAWFDWGVKMAPKKGTLPEPPTIEYYFKWSVRKSKDLRRFETALTCSVHGWLNMRSASIRDLLGLCKNTTSSFEYPEKWLKKKYSPNNQRPDRVRLWPCIPSFNLGIN